MKLKSIAYHRNSVTGEPFYAIAFTDQKQDLIATVFLFGDEPCPGRVAVLNADCFGIGTNAPRYRGDHYEPQLRQWIAQEQARAAPTRGVEDDEAGETMYEPWNGVPPGAVAKSGPVFSREWHILEKISGDRVAAVWCNRHPIRGWLTVDGSLMHTPSEMIAWGYRYIRQLDLSE